MNSLPDAFELALIRKTFIWISAFFLTVFSASLITTFAYYGSALPLSDAMILFRSLLVALNAGALLTALRIKATDAAFLRLPSLVMMANFALSLMIVLSSRGNITHQMGIFFVQAIIYLMISGLFFQSQVRILLYGLTLIGIAIVIFELFPERLFSQELDAEGLYVTMRWVLLFGLSSATALVFITSKIAGTVLIHTRAYAEQLRKLAYFDHDTGLPNGLQLEQDIREWEENHRGPAGERMAMIGFRLDGLEALNETDGVEATNSLLKTILRLYVPELERLAKERIEDGAPDTFKTLYRVESNSFIFLTKAPQAALAPEPSQTPLLSGIIQRLLADHHGKGVLTFHGGFSFYPDEAPSIRQLFRNILNLLHNYREENKGHFIAFNPGLYKDYLRQEAIRVELQRAIKENDFTLAFQPRVAVASGRTMGFEALARWTSPSLGIVSPAEFIPLTEKFSLIQTLTLQLLEKTFEFLRRLHDGSHNGLRVSLNLSPGILNADFLDLLLGRVEESGLGPSLELEITEGLLMKLDPVVLTAFHRLKKLGVDFAIDDFGTGYSNLGYLQSFEAEILKIDKRFIDGTPMDDKNSKLVTAILQMARSFGMTVVAEGVEYKEQRDFLLENGCDQIQGYYYSKPLAGPDALEFIARGKKPSDTAPS